MPVTVQKRARHWYFGMGELCLCAIYRVVITPWRLRACVLVSRPDMAQDSGFKWAARVCRTRSSVSGGLVSAPISWSSAYGIVQSDCLVKSYLLPWAIIGPSSNPLASFARKSDDFN